MSAFAELGLLRKLALALPGMSLAACFAAGNAAPAQGNGPQNNTPVTKTYLNKTAITLPVLLEDKYRSQLQGIHLYVKEGPAAAWQLHEKAAPTQTSFTYRAPREGEYWFSIVSVDTKGQSVPQDVNKEPPGLVVVIDTQSPQVDVQPLHSAPEGQYFRSNAKDIHLDLLKTRVHYQTGDQMWRDLIPQPGKLDTYCVPSQAVWTGMIRTVAIDLAGNTTTRELNLGSLAAEGPTPGAVMEKTFSALEAEKNLKTNGTDKLVAVDPKILERVERTPTSVSLPPLPSQPPLPQPSLPLSASTPSTSTQQKPAALPQDLLVQQVPSGPAGVTLYDPSAKVTPPPPSNLANVKTTSLLTREPAPANRHIANSMRMFLDYKVDSLGASGVGRVEVWYTRDLGQSWHKLCDDTDRKSPAEINLPGEGLFGLTLVISNGRGFGAAPPKTGEAPDYWVEIDTTRPLGDITAIHAADDGALHITWAARDKNLASEPIEISYAAQREGPWTTIAKGLKNDGLYRWAPPVEVGPHAFFRLTIRDQAGNVSSSETNQPVPLDDQSRPRGRVLGVVTSAPRTSEISTPLPPLP